MHDHEFNLVGGNSHTGASAGLLGVDHFSLVGQVARAPVSTVEPESAVRQNEPPGPLSTSAPSLVCMAGDPVLSHEDPKLTFLRSALDRTFDESGPALHETFHDVFKWIELRSVEERCATRERANAVPSAKSNP